MTGISCPVLRDTDSLINSINIKWSNSQERCVTSKGKVDAHFRKDHWWTLMLLVVEKYLAGLPRWLSGRESACQARDLGSVPGSEHPQEKEMATHSSILIWRIWWAEECGRLHLVLGVAKNQM